MGLINEVYQFLPDDAKGAYNKIASEARHDFLKSFVRSDFEAFVYVLGYRDLGVFHKEQIKLIGQVRYITDVASRRLWLWSRGFFKTSLITESHSLFLIVNNPNIRILLTSNTIGISEDILRNIKNHLMINQNFRHFFPEFCPMPNTVGKIEFGTSQDFTVKCRSRALKEPTMMCAGVGTNLTGLHFDYIKGDDLVTKDSVSNDTQIQASKDYYASLRHLFDKAAVPREDIVGTIYHFNDLYSLQKKTKLFDESFVPCMINGLPTFPERLPEYEIERLMNDPSIGPYQFQTQYMLNPINPADAKFKEEWLKYYDDVPDGCAEYIVCDPASTLKKRSDYTVIERWKVDNNGKHYLVDGIRDKLTAYQRIDRLFEFVKRAKNLKWVSYEVLGGRHGDLEIIEQRKRETGIYFNVKEAKAGASSKTDRIEQRLVGAYHAGIILLPKEIYFKSLYDGRVYNFIELLKLEYLQFPFTEHDDILDAQAQMFEEQLIRGDKAKFEVKKDKSEGMTADQWDQMYSYVGHNKAKYGLRAHENMFMTRMKRLVRKAQ